MVHTHTKIIALITTGIFVAVLVGFVGFWYYVDSQKTKLIEARIAVATQQLQQQSLSTLEKIVESSKADRSELNSIILTEDGVIDLLTLIETIGFEQGTVLKTNALTVTPLNELFETLSITVEVSGTYDAIMRVLTLLENLPYQSSVPKVQMQREGQTAIWKGIIDVRVTKFKKS